MQRRSKRLNHLPDDDSTSASVSIGDREGTRDGYREGVFVGTFLLVQ